MKFEKTDNRVVKSADKNFSIKLEGKADLIYEENEKRLVIYTDSGVYRKRP